MVTFLKKTTRLQQVLHQIPYSVHHRHLCTCSAIFTILAQDLKADGDNLDIHRTTHLLWYERNNHILVVSSRDDKNK